MTDVSPALPPPSKKTEIYFVTTAAQAPLKHPSPLDGDGGKATMPTFHLRRPPLPFPFAQPATRPAPSRPVPPHLPARPPRPRWLMNVDG